MKKEEAMARLAAELELARQGKSEEFLRYRKSQDETPQDFIEEIVDVAAEQYDLLENVIEKIIAVYECDAETAILLYFFIGMNELGI